MYKPKNNSAHFCMKRFATYTVCGVVVVVVCVCVIHW